MSNRDSQVYLRNSRRLSGFAVLKFQDGVAVRGESWATAIRNFGRLLKEMTLDKDLSKVKVCARLE